MTHILIAARAADRDAAGRLRERLANYYDEVRIISSTADLDAIRSATALVIVIGPGWTPQATATAEDETIFYKAAAAGLADRDLLVINALVEDAKMPTAASLPESLRALPYMNRETIREDAFERDVDTLARTIRTTLDDLTRDPAIAAQVAPAALPPRAARRDGPPWNLIIIGIAVAAALLFMLIPRLRGDTNDLAFTDISEVSGTPDASLLDDDGPAGDILLGLAAGLSGGTASRGESMLLGAELALLERGVLVVDGVEFTVDLVTQDARCSASGGLQTAELFVIDPDIAAVIGHMCDASCTSAAPVYDAAGFASVSPACTSPRLDAESFYRVIPSSGAGARAAAEFVYGLLDLTEGVVIISDEDFAGRPLAGIFAAHYAELGGEARAVIEIETQSLELDAFISEVLDEEPALVYFAGRASTAAALAVALEDTPLMLANGSDVNAFIEQAGDAAEGTFIARILPPSGSAYDVLAADYVAAFDAEPDGPIFAYAYDAVNMVMDALVTVGEVDADGAFIFDRAELRATLREYAGEGVTGPLACDERGDCSAGAAIVEVIDGGELREYITGDVDETDTED